MFPMRSKSSKRAARSANYLRARGASFEDVYDAELVFGELIGNIVRYAPGRAEVNLDWSGALPVLHVLDDGPGFRHIALLPSDLYSRLSR